MSGLKVGGACLPIGLPSALKVAQPRLTDSARSPSPCATPPSTATITSASFTLRLYLVEKPDGKDGWRAGEGIQVGIELSGAGPRGSPFGSIARRPDRAAGAISYM